MDLRHIEKPRDSIEKILSHFSISKPCLLDPGQPLSIRKRSENQPRKIYFLLEGAMISSVGENEKKQNLGVVVSPAIIGLGQLSSADALAQYESLSPCMVDSISVDDFIKVIETHRLWPDLIAIMIAMVNHLAARSAMSGLQSAYEIIRSNLLYMESETACALKERYTVVKYMQTFSRLSRSIILKILSELKAGGFIEMEKGKLIRISRNLPDRF